MRIPFLLVLPLITFSGTSAFGEQIAPTFSQKLDIQVRYDDRSNRPSREQYRLRYYPSLAITSAWSLNSFVVTGDDFSSSHNTFGSDNTDYLYARRLYLRHETESGKTELGIIPTYKGRVSSTGLSKDGWITGVRHVRQLQNDTALEVVVGQLANAEASEAFNIGGEDAYFEIEYSAKMDHRHSYEASFEKMLGGTFARAEYRFRMNDKDTAFIELVQRTDESAAKIVVGTSGEFDAGAFNTSYPIDYFAYYSYIDSSFGERAELIEDFLGTGHGGSLEVSGVLSEKHDVEWFVRADVVDSVSRLLAGVKLSFES
ncbi:hypothetical protein [Alteromonas sp. S005]|uniref:hypothetical protein n=1 Tax=Alteromonas sp. S005 TaxID=3117400 RepID=UPI002FE1604A